MQDIDNALNNAYAQRQISTLYTQRNQYRVILEIDPHYQRDPNDLVAHLRHRRERRAGAALRRDQDRARPAAAGDQPSGPVSRRDDQLQPGARRAHRGRDRAVDRAVAEHAHARHAARRIRRRRPRLPAVDRRAAAADPRGADRGLHRARRALREPRASAHDHLDAAVGRARRAAGAAAVPAPSCR